jgi:peptide/nickel transport system substrate-binding protein
VRVAVALLTLTLVLGCRSRSHADAAVALDPAWLAGTPPAETASPTPGGTLVVRVMSEPGGLNPLDDAFRDGWVTRITNRLILETLVVVQPTDFSLAPGLATWVESADHRRVTFTLRAATFSDGSALRADDVVASIAAVMNPVRPTGVLRGELAGLASWQATGPTTVMLEWANPTPFSLRALSHVPILRAADLAAADWSKLAHAPIGTGPYVLSSWERGQALTLTHRTGAPGFVEQITFRFVKDHTVAATLFEQGEFDVMTNLQPAQWRQLEGPSGAWAQRGYARLLSVDNSFSYIAWSERHPALADVRVRQALSHLYDAALISRVVDLGLELPTSCPFLRGSDSCDPTLVPSYSVDTARTLLRDAGFTERDGVLERDGVPFAFTFLLPATSVRLGKLVPLLQEQFKAVGIDMKLEKVETATLSARQAKRDFDAISRVWTEFDREEDLFPLFHSSQRDGGANVTGFSDPEVDRLLETLHGEFEPTKRRALERQLHRAIVERQPLLIMTARQSLDMAKKRVHGLTPSLTWYDLTKVWVEH